MVALPQQEKIDFQTKGFSLSIRAKNQDCQKKQLNFTMKNKYIIAIFIIGVLWIILGYLFKILHFEIGFITGNYFLSFGIFLDVLALIIFVIKTVTNKKDSFLNR